jgi:hypothetical protein
MSLQVTGAGSSPEPLPDVSIAAAEPAIPEAPVSARAAAHDATHAPQLYVGGHRMPHWLAELVRHLPGSLISGLGIQRTAPLAGSARPRGIDRVIMPVRSMHAFSRHSDGHSLASKFLRKNAWALPYTGNILPVPYVLQESADECWRSAFNMIGRYYGRPDIDYSDMPELYNDGEYGLINDSGTMQEVLRRESLQAVAGCNDQDRDFSMEELGALWRERGPLAFSWQPPNIQLFMAHPERHHWCVIVKVDPDTNRITYLNPMRRRTDPEGKRVRKDWISIDEFNSLRTRRSCSILHSTLDLDEAAA